METDQLIDEIKEDVRLEQVLTFFKRYANWVIGGILGLFLGVGAYVYWTSYAEKQHLTRAKAYEDALAMLATQNKAAGEKMLDALAADPTSGYGILATFKKAYLPHTTPSARVDILTAVEKNTKIDLKFRQLATLMRLYETFDSLDSGAIATALGHVVDQEGPFRLHGQEMLAWSFLKVGDMDRAKPILTSIVKNQSAAPSLRARAMLLLDPRTKND